MLVRLAEFALLLLIAPTASLAEGPKTISGRVTDQAGRVVPGASVAAYWGANGLNQEQYAAFINDKGKKVEEIWRNEGKMEPLGDLRPVITDADGLFSIAVPERRRSLMIQDRERRRGAVVFFDPKHPEIPVEARLTPLVRIFGTNRLSGSNKPLEWTCTYLNVPYSEDDPLNGARLAICGSYQSRFDFMVPPGTYDVRASSDSSLETPEDRSITIGADRAEVDLGSLFLRPRSGGVQNLIDRAKARGTWADYKQNFGKEPPPWHLTDAKGIAKGARLSDFKGRWAVLYFWGPNCPPCLGKELPELMAFYDAHKGRRDRFEILAFCCDFGETLPDIAALDRHLKDVKKVVWGGRDLPFPVLLDNTFQTYERFGLEGNGVSNTLLINPEGRLVEGGLKDLARTLERSEEVPR